jgi:hypothetical protein
MIVINSQKVEEDFDEEKYFDDAPPVGVGDSNQVEEEDELDAYMKGLAK